MTIKVKVTNTPDGGSRPCKVTTYDIATKGTTSDGRVFAGGEHVTAHEDVLAPGESCEVWIHSSRNFVVSEVEGS